MATPCRFISATLKLGLYHLCASSQQEKEKDLNIFKLQMTMTGGCWWEELPQIKSIRGPGCWGFPCFRNLGRCSPGALPEDDSVQRRETLGSQSSGFLFPLGFSSGVHTACCLAPSRQLSGIDCGRPGGKCDLAGIWHPEHSVINITCYFLGWTEWNCYCSSIGQGFPQYCSCVFPVISLPMTL